jgi:hypothetical protein
MDHEAALIKAFVVSAKKARFLTLLQKPKHRPKALNGLNHLHDLDPRFLIEIPPGEQNPESIAVLLTERGAPAMCHLISSASDLDGEDMPLASALRRIVGFGAGTLISCVPGRLAYFEGEEAKDRYILQRDMA